jgi:phage tail-like protein
MTMMLPLPGLTDPPLSFRFGVFFIMGGFSPNALDIRFSKVSGIGSRIDTQPLNEGGQNLFSHHMPLRGQTSNLVLERSMEINSELFEEFNNTLTLFQFNPCDVLVTLLNETGMPIRGWKFITAYPVVWKISDLDAENNKVVIETMELAYQSMQTVSL